MRWALLVVCIALGCGGSSPPVESAEPEPVEPTAASEPVPVETPRETDPCYADLSADLVQPEPDQDAFHILIGSPDGLRLRLDGDPTDQHLSHWKELRAELVAECDNLQYRAIVSYKEYMRLAVFVDADNIENVLGDETQVAPPGAGASIRLLGGTKIDSGLEVGDDTTIYVTLTSNGTRYELWGKVPNDAVDYRYRVGALYPDPDLTVGTWAETNGFTMFADPGGTAFLTARGKSKVRIVAGEIDGYRQVAIDAPHLQGTGWVKIEELVLDPPEPQDSGPTIYGGILGSEIEEKSRVQPGTILYDEPNGVAVGGAMEGVVLDEATHHDNGWSTGIVVTPIGVLTLAVETAYLH